MINEGDIPFCLDERTGGWYGATGYEGNVVSGNYTAPDGARGNVYEGPCPGSYYIETSNGCAIVPAGQQAEASVSGSVVSATPTSDVVGPTSSTSAAGGHALERGKLATHLIGLIGLTLL
ncbi:hypothetical protein K402DRAFT_390321 [Aulographum hederae CBS 113979]|uniref:Uncharacterized protein n=1 Tax=Aulographum hederae CBS 113979 TaxID=1176131 RepID=A0A6G1H9U4_9PEZI|nr:hypothetical protein K402DRAFT_390321 [Aulographum hederae CBS 113979]